MRDAGIFILTVTASADGSVVEINHPMGSDAWVNARDAMKYLWRADEKGNALEDLRKAAWYLAREIARREAEMTRSAAGN